MVSIEGIAYPKDYPVKGLDEIKKVSKVVQENGALLAGFLKTAKSPLGIALSPSLLFFSFFI